MTIKERIEAFVKHADDVVKAHWEQQGFTFSPPPTHEADFSTKWAKIVTVEHTHEGKATRTSVYAFVALQDSQTKGLGIVKTGDIHKAATWNSPAKHARGSVFSENFNGCATPHGIVYLRG